MNKLKSFFSMITHVYCKIYFDYDMNLQYGNKLTNKNQDLINKHLFFNYKEIPKDFKLEIIITFNTIVLLFTIFLIILSLFRKLFINNKFMYTYRILCLKETCIIFLLINMVILIT